MRSGKLNLLLVLLGYLNHKAKKTQYDTQLSFEHNLFLNLASEDLCFLILLPSLVLSKSNLVITELHKISKHQLKASLFKYA